METDIEKQLHQMSGSDVNIRKIFSAPIYVLWQIVYFDGIL